MLYNEHCKAGKELQRRIVKLREENKDPSLPQKPTRINAPAVAASSTVSKPSASSSSLQLPSKMSDSQTVDESFMLLGQSRVSLLFYFIKISTF